MTVAIVLARLFIASYIVLNCAGAAANTQRIAIVVGNNTATGQVSLRYAERDARRMQDVLKELGGVSQTTLMLGQSAQSLRHTLASLNKRMSNPGVSNPNDTVLFFYYSGHADEHGLLLGQTRYEFAELRKQFQQFAARVCVVVIDACQSGRMARRKGGMPVPTVDVSFHDDQEYRGRVYITSSAAGENSQESDDLQASYFTHFLISGLRGAADETSDARVSLDEAYRYAYRHTLQQTASTLVGPQHPTYDLDVTGRGQLILTQIAAGRSTLVIAAADAQAGNYMIVHRASGDVVAEVRPNGARPNSVRTANAGQPVSDPLRLALAPGRYDVLRLVADKRWVQTVQLHAGQQLQLSARAFSPTTALWAKGKGGAYGDQPHTLYAGYQLRSGYLQQSAAIHGLNAAYLWQRGKWRWGGGVGYGYSHYVRPDSWSITYHELSAAGIVRWLPLSFEQYGEMGIGAKAGLVWGFQTATTATQNESRNQPLFDYRLQLGGNILAWSPLIVGLWGHVGQSIYRSGDQTHTPFSGGAEVSVGVYF